MCCGIVASDTQLTLEAPATGSPGSHSTQHRDDLVPIAEHVDEQASPHVRKAAAWTALAASEKKLAAANANNAYVHLYAVNSGLVTTEYQNLILCDVYVSCRAAAQNMLTDMSSFQTARSNAVVPPALADADSQVGAALIAGIAADKELTSAMDAADSTKIQEGFKKLDTAMLALARAESAVAASIS